MFSFFSSPVFFSHLSFGDFHKNQPFKCFTVNNLQDYYWFIYLFERFWSFFKWQTIMHNKIMNEFNSLWVLMMNKKLIDLRHFSTTSSIDTLKDKLFSSIGMQIRNFRLVIYVIFLIWHLDTSVWAWSVGFIDLTAFAVRLLYNSIDVLAHSCGATLMMTARNIFMTTSNELVADGRYCSLKVSTLQRKCSSFNH